MHIKFMFLFLSFSLLLACSSGDDGPSGPDGTCGTMEAPMYFEITDIVPAPGSTVENEGIVQSFRMVAPEGAIEQASRTLSINHTAGEPVPDSFGWQYMADGADLVYTASVQTSWEYAPALVEMTFSSLYAVGDNCIYGFPPSLFSYNVVPVGSLDSDTTLDTDTQ